MYQIVLYRVNKNKAYEYNNCGQRLPANSVELRTGIEYLGDEKKFKLSKLERENIKFLKRKYPANVQQYKLYLRVQRRNKKYA